MSLASIWRDIADQWNSINTHANKLLWEVFEQDYFVMNNLTAYVNELYQNVSRNVDQLEMKTYNALSMVRLALINLIDAVDLHVEARFRGLEAIINTHLHNITNKLEDAVRLIKDTGSMDYEYVDNEIYWALYDVNLELDNLQRQIDAITGISETKVKELIDEAVTELETFTLLTINTVKKKLLGKIDDVYDWFEVEILDLSRWIDAQLILVQTAINDVAVNAKQYVDDKADEIYAYLVSQNEAVKRYIDSQIEDAMVDVDVAVDELRVEMGQQLTALETTLNERREKLLEDLVILVTNTELRIMDKVRPIGARVDTLADTTTWRAGFFDIFRSIPELSFLQVLLRDDAKFAEFKPYWQALFTRVMSED